MGTVTIRPFRPADQGDVSDVCVRTGLGGHDASGLYSDDGLLPDIFARPYLAFEPELAFVADTGDRVSGYMLATADTRRFVERYRADWLPRLESAYRRDEPPLTPEDEMVKLGLWPEHMLIPEVDDYPAHLHIDLLPELQGKGIGRALINTLLGALQERGIRGLHLTMDPANVAARGFYDRLGFTELPSSTPEAPVLGIRPPMLLTSY